MPSKHTLMLAARALALTLATLGTAHATQGAWDNTATPANGFNGLTTSWSQAAAGALYAEWNWFTDDSTSAGIQDFTPDVGSSGTSISHVYETSGAAFVTGGGNIYSFAAPTAITGVIGDASGTTTGTRTVALRIATLGTLPAATATLNGLSATVIELYSGDSGSGFGGAEKEFLWVWKDVAAAANYTFKFNSIESSMSLDQLAFYASPATAAPVPEPTTSILMLAGLGAVGLVARRRAAR